MQAGAFVDVTDEGDAGADGQAAAAAPRRTPLHLAALGGFAEAAQALVQVRVDKYRIRRATFLRHLCFFASHKFVERGV